MDKRNVYYQTKTKMSKLIKTLWDNLAIRQIMVIFDNDAHNIVSKKGWIIIEELNQNKDE